MTRIKRLFCLLCAAVLALSLCSCSKKDEGAKEDSANSSTPVDAFEERYLDPQAISVFKNKKTICTYEGVEYYEADYTDSHLICYNEKSGNARVLFEYDSNTSIEFFTDTFTRSGGSSVYFMQTFADSGEKKLCRFYLPSLTATVVVGSPCSNFLLPDMPESFEMYAYGCIVTGSEINVISLADGSISGKYSSSIEKLSSYMKMPDAFFSSGSKSHAETVIKDEGDRKHIRVITTQYNSKGEAASSSEFLFTSALGVATPAE